MSYFQEIKDLIFILGITIMSVFVRILHALYKGIKINVKKELLRWGIGVIVAYLVGLSIDKDIVIWGLQAYSIIIFGTSYFSVEVIDFMSNPTVHAKMKEIFFTVIK